MSEQQPQPQEPVVIMGAGIAGLTVAYHLLKKQEAGEAEKFPVILLEKEERPGGLAISLSREGIVTDLGPHRLHTELPEVKELLNEVAQEHLLTVSRESHLYWKGHRLKYPIAPFELLKKIGPIEMGKLGLGAVAAKAGITGAEDDADSFENVMRAQFGGGLWREMLGPYSEKVWKMKPGEIHGDVARVRVSAGGITQLAKRLIQRGDEKQGQETALKSFRYPKGGLQTLVDILERRVTELGGTIHCNAPIDEIAKERSSTGPDDAHLKRVTRIEAGGQTFDNPRAVVSTLPLPILGGFFGEELTQETDELDYLSMLLVVLVVNRDRLTRDNWLYFFDDDFVINRAYEAKNFDPGMAPDGKTALCCEVTCRFGDQFWSGDHDELAGHVADQVAGTGLFDRDELATSFVHPLRWAYPIYSLDYHDRLQGIYDTLMGYTNLMTCGRQGLFNHNNTDHSMSMGMSAADTILAHPRDPATPWYHGLQDRFSHFRIVD
jgi:protoporphyrinogen oxidase